MNFPLELARPLAYWLMMLGYVLALVTAFEPEPTCAWHLATGYLASGLIPYIVYGSFTDILDGCTIVIAGSILLASDLLVLPLGVAPGKLLSKMQSSSLHP